MVTPSVPYGGVNQSGFGRNLGEASARPRGGGSSACGWRRLANMAAPASAKNAACPGRPYSERGTKYGSIAYLLSPPWVSSNSAATIFFRCSRSAASVSSSDRPSVWRNAMPSST